MRFFLIIILGVFLTFQGAAQHKIIVKVKEIPSSKGKISAALYRNQATFLKFDAVFASASNQSEKGTTTVVFNDIPEGEYAIALFHDENGNDVLDTNWMGIPKEKVAFSKAKMKLFGPPKFKECAFTLKKNLTLEIPL
ncbi:MAG: DUF2141 domain-containing protein [Bacteroidota bacterium]